MSAKPDEFRAVIRPMRADDLDAVLRVEQNAYRFPWSRGIFSDCLIAGYQSLVLDQASSVLGYGIMSVAAAEAHILNICVDVSLRRRGLGRQLLEGLLQRAAAMQVERLFLEVRPSNLEAVGLYESSGFTVLGIRKNYYKAEDGREDALVFVREIS
jgi:ribosomal-protein-alanine N-acetyltransferase